MAEITVNQTIVVPESDKTAVEEPRMESGSPQVVKDTFSLNSEKGQVDPRVAGLLVVAAFGLILLTGSAGRDFLGGAKDFLGQKKDEITMSEEQKREIWWENKLGGYLVYARSTGDEGDMGEPMREYYKDIYGVDVSGLLQWAKTTPGLTDEQIFKKANDSVGLPKRLISLEDYWKEKGR